MYPTATASRKPYFNPDKKILFLNRRQLPRHFKDKLPWTTLQDYNEYCMLACPIKEEDEVKIDAYLSDKTSEQDKETLLVELEINYPHVDFTKILMYGNANQRRTSYRQFEFVIQYYYINHSSYHGQKEQYIRLRSYERSYEQWVETAAFVNLCADDKMAWQSIIRKLGGHWVRGLNNTFQPFRIVVWADPITEFESIEKYGI